MNAIETMQRELARLREKQTELTTSIELAREQIDRLLAEREECLKDDAKLQAAIQLVHEDMIERSSGVGGGVEYVVKHLRLQDKKKP